MAARDVWRFPPWTPTLFEIGDRNVQAATGRRLVWRLTRLLGFGKTLRVAQLVGELSSPRAVENASRRNFIKSAGRGFAAGATILAFGRFPQASLASSSEVAERNTVESLTGEELDGYLRQIKANPDVQNAINHVSGNQSLLSAREQREQGHAARQTDENGEDVIVTAMPLTGTHILVINDFKRRNVSQALVYEVHDETNIKFVAGSANGDPIPMDWDPGPGGGNCHCDCLGGGNCI